jgi:hypothetical protein
MKKIYIISFITLLVFSLTGCKKDFLEVQPTEFLTEQQVAEAAQNNPDVVAGSVSGIYTLMFQTGTGGSNPLNHDDFGQKGYDIYSDFLCGDLALSISTYGWYRLQPTSHKLVTTCHGDTTIVLFVRQILLFLHLAGMMLCPNWTKINIFWDRQKP